MKNKTINSKIEALSHRIKSIKSKTENAKYLNESGIFQTLESDLEAAIVLQKDVDTLKGTLKTKTKELEDGIRKLKKGNKDARKMLKVEHKTIKLPKEKKIQNGKLPASKVPVSKKKKTKSEEKTAKGKK